MKNYHQFGVDHNLGEYKLNRKNLLRDESNLINNYLTLQHPSLHLLTITAQWIIDDIYYCKINSKRQTKSIALNLAISDGSVAAMHLLIFVASTAADTGDDKAEERQQSADRDSPVTPGIVIFEEKVYHVIGFPLDVLSYPETRPKTPLSEHRTHDITSMRVSCETEHTQEYYYAHVYWEPIAYDKDVRKVRTYFVRVALKPILLGFSFRSNRIHR